MNSTLKIFKRDERIMGHAKHDFVEHIILS